jgi:hypothetical protein
MSDARLNSVPVDGGTRNAFIQGYGIILNAEEGESIVITDIIARSSGQLTEDTALGDVIITIPVFGHSSLTTPIKVSKGASVFNNTLDGADNNENQISINYYKVRH